MVFCVGIVEPSHINWANGRKDILGITTLLMEFLSSGYISKDFDYSLLRLSEKKIIIVKTIGNFLVLLRITNCWDCSWY